MCLNLHYLVCLSWITSVSNLHDRVIFKLTSLIYDYLVNFNLTSYDLVVIWPDKINPQPKLAKQIHSVSSRNKLKEQARNYLRRARILYQHIREEGELITIWAAVDDSIENDEEKPEVLNHIPYKIITIPHQTKESSFSCKVLVF